MNYTKEAKIVDDLTSTCQVVHQIDQGLEEAKSFGFDEDNISFVGMKNINNYDMLIEKLYVTDKEVFETYSFNKFEEVIIKLIKFLKSQNSKCTSDQFDHLLSGLLNNDLEEYEILYPFHGSQMNSNFIEFGDFTIYNRQKCEDLLNEKHPKLKEHKTFFDHLKTDLIIGVKVKTRDSDKAIEIADQYCLSFENVFSFVLGDITNKRRIGIFNFRNWSTTGKLIYSERYLGFQAKSDVILSLNLNHRDFKNPAEGNDIIWSLITKKDKTQIEKRLLNSIEWIGKAINDRDRSKSLVQFVFSIEGMLQYDDKAFISQSIVSQLSDSLAFIITDEPKSRKLIVKKFKDAYQKRSRIAHGGTAKVELEDLAVIFDIAQNMIVSFLTKSPYKEIATMNQLTEHLTTLKFS